MEGEIFFNWDFDYLLFAKKRKLIKSCNCTTIYLKNIIKRILNLFEEQKIDFRGI